MRLNKLYILTAFLLAANFLSAQNYQAINGSGYAGSLGVGNNPASIVQVPYTWDITPFAVQAKQATNAFVINNYSLLSSPSNATIVTVPNALKRFVFTNQNIRLLNARINLNSKSAIAFGANIRSASAVTSSKLTWPDSSGNTTVFMGMNGGNLPLNAEFRGSAWAELYGSYARTIVDDGNRILTAGITIKINRNLAGGYANASNLNYTPAPGNTGRYLLTGGNLQYGYSSNFDEIDSSRSASANGKSFFQHSMAGISIDAGLEYILPDDNGDGEDNGFSYRTKIGISLMDVGRNRFRYGSRSSSATAGKAGVNDSSIAMAFSNINSIDDFNNGVKSIANTFISQSGTFNIYQPARVIINVDQHLNNNFYLNGELTLAVFPLVPKNIAYIKDMNLLAVTPRWETKRWGAYLPVMLNTRNQLWVGGAFKAGPLLLGTHNLADIFSKNKMQNGGFYLALTFRSGKSNDGSESEKSAKGSRKGRQSLECPRL